MGISLENTDLRILELRYIPGFPYNDVVLELKQIDLLRVIRALEKTHTNKMIIVFKQFIKAIDKFEKVETDFNKQIARRSE